MPSRNELNMRAAAVGLDPSTIANDSKLEQKVLFLEKNSSTVTGTAPTTTLTSTGTAGNNETFTIGSRTYTLKTTLTGAANEVLIGAAATNTLDNIKEAINGTGTPGTNYSQTTLRHPLVTAGTKTATTLVITATDTNIAGSIASTETMANFSFTGAALSNSTLGAIAQNTATYNGPAGVSGDRNTSV